MSTNRITSGTERTVIENTLDRNREALIATARGLSDATARRRLVASLTTPISLIKHAALRNGSGSNGSGRDSTTPNATDTRTETRAPSPSPTTSRWPT
jgi:hypothetical protein